MSDQPSPPGPLATAPSSSPVKKGGFATVSFWLAVLWPAWLVVAFLLNVELDLGPALLLPVVTSTCAFVFGAIALYQIKRSGGRIIGRDQAMKGLVIGVMTLLLPAVFIWPAVRGGLERNRRAECLGNLKQLGSAMGEYAGAHSGKTPVKLEDLKPYVHGNWEKISRCPGALDKSVPSYELVGAGIAWEDVPDVIVLREKPNNHRGKFEGGNVLYNDGHVAWVPSRDRAPSE